MRNKISGVPHKHDHVSGRPRDYISRKKFYKGKHRGEYRPRPHWRCKTCTTSCNCPVAIGIKSIKLSAYIPPGGEVVFSPFSGDETVPIKFPVQ